MPENQGGKCSHCGARYGIPNNRKQCAACVLRDLDPPDNASFFEFQDRGDKYGKQYSAFSVVGCGIRHLPDVAVEVFAPTFVRSDGTLWEFRHIEIGWLPSTVYLEARWNAQAPAQIAILNFQSAQEEDSKRAGQAKRLVTTFANAGRPPLNEQDENVRREIVRRAEDMYRKHPGVTRDKIARQIGIVPDTLKKWLHDYPVE